MKKLFGLVAGLIIATAANAQINVGANFLMGLPSGAWNEDNFVSTAFGGGIEGNYFVSDNISVGLEVGFLSFGTDIEESTFSAIPISLKGEYYFLDDNFRPFVGLGIGYYMVSNKTTIPALPPFLPEPTEINFTLNGLGISPRVGAVYQVSDLIGIVLNVNYNLLFGQTVGGDGEGDVDNATNWIGVGIGARFTLVD